MPSIHRTMEKWGCRWSLQIPSMTYLSHDECLREGISHFSSLPIYKEIGNPNQGKPHFPYITPCENSTHILKQILTLKITTHLFFLLHTRVPLLKLCFNYWSAIGRTQHQYKIFVGADIIFLEIKVYVASMWSSPINEHQQLSL